MEIVIRWIIVNLPHCYQMYKCMCFSEHRVFLNDHTIMYFWIVCHLTTSQKMTQFLFFIWQRVLNICGCVPAVADVLRHKSDYRLISLPCRTLWLWCLLLLQLPALAVLSQHPLCCAPARFHHRPPVCLESHWRWTCRVQPAINRTNILPECSS